MTEAYVLDASIAVKWYVPEQNHEAARVLRDGYLDGEYDLVAPTLLPYEVINALRYTGLFEPEQLRDAAETFPRYGIELVPFHRLGPVTDVAADLDSSIYDAAYVALAETRDTTAYTADEKLVGKAKRNGYGERVSAVDDIQ